MMNASRKQPTPKTLTLTTLNTQRWTLPMMVIAAVFLLLFSLVQPQLAENARTRMTDAFTVVLATVATPVGSAAHFIATLGNLTELRAENERLLAENERLRQYQNAVMKLEAENKGLRDLLKMQIDPTQRTTTARVIADVGGPFIRNIVILAGYDEGLRNGLVALAGGGLAGRIVSVGRHSSRILMINDISARVPVLLESSRQRGLVEGDNSEQLRLTSLPPDIMPTIGERIITSGVGGIYPAGIPVGVISHAEGGIIRVEPLADLGRLEFVQVLDPGTPEDLLSPESTSSHAPAARP